MPTPDRDEAPTADPTTTPEPSPRVEPSGDVAPRNRYAVRYERTFQTLWNTVSRLWRSLPDDAMRDDPENARRMILDANIRGLLQERILPSTSLPFTIKPDDPKRPRQAAVAQDLAKILEATPRLGSLKRYLQRSIFYGRYGAQIRTGEVMVGGKSRVAITGHKPASGDKFNFDWDDTPAFLVATTWAGDAWEKVNSDVRTGDRGGRYLMLDRPYWRDRFVIQEDDPFDRDFYREADLAGQVHGEGLRQLIYFPWLLNQQLIQWKMDAAERLGINGSYYAFCEAGNEEEEEATLEALAMLVKDNIACFKRTGKGELNGLTNIPPSNVAYEVIDNFIAYNEDKIRYLIVGQTLSSDTAPTGMGSSVAELHRTTKESLIRVDVDRLGETFTTDVLGPIIRANYGSLPFQVRLEFTFDRGDRLEILQTAQLALAVGLQLDREDLQQQSGFKAPTDPAHALVAPAAASPSGAAGKSGADNAGAPTPEAPAPKVATPSTPREAQYAAEHAPPGGADVNGRHFAPGEFLPGSGQSAGGGRAEVPEVAPHHRKIAYRIEARAVRSDRGGPLPLDPGEPSAREAKALARWDVAGVPAAIVAHDPDRPEAYARDEEAYDEDDVAEARRHPYSVLAPIDGGHEALGHHPTLDAALAHAREVAADAREAEGVDSDDLIVPAGEPLSHHVPDFDPSTHRGRLREKRPSKAELADLAAADRDDWLARHPRDSFPTREAHAAALKAHVASRLPPGAAIRP